MGFGLRSIRSIQIVLDHIFDDLADSIFKKLKKFRYATFEGIKPIVLGFFRIGIRFERILGRSPQFLQKWRFEIFTLFEYFRIDGIDRTYRTQCVSLVSIEGRPARSSVDDDGQFGLGKNVVRDLSYRPQNKSIWSLISRGS